MRDRITAVFRKGTGTFGSFSPGQKAVTIFALVALVIGGYFFATWAGQPTYAPLFSGLAPADASAIVDQLTTDAVPYKLADGGTTVMVPEGQVYGERIKVSAAGLPSQGEAGYELLDKQGVMTSEFMQQVTYRRALEGELSKTIKSIDGVKAAAVHLAIPEKDVFTDDARKPTASVLIDTGTRSLSSGQVQSVVHLVASSVEGLDPANVTVVGASGKVLSGSEGSSEAGGAADSADAATAYEQRLNGALQKLLETVLGPNHSAVQVTADLDFDATETKTQRYVSDPTTPPLSESKKTEAFTGNGGVSTGGVLGPDNIQVPAGAANGGPGTYQQSTETRNNAVGMVTETRKGAPGTVKKLSVAVVIDSSVANVNTAQLQQLVSSAVGLNPQRGDMIAVSSMAFDQTAAKAEASAQADASKAAKGAVRQKYTEMGAIVLAILVLMIVAALSGRKNRKENRKELTADANAALEEMQAAIEQARAKMALEGSGGGGAAGALESSPPSPGELAEREARQRNLALLVERQPDEVAQLLRGWLADRRG
jgi:flagellar M-ring protein FliF